MTKNEIILTREGLQQLEEELEYLKTVRRREVAERIKQAIDFGDISENSEYEDAKNEQAFIEGRIMSLEQTLRNARLIEDDDILADRVSLGCTVRLQDTDSGKELSFIIVSSAESDPKKSKISDQSPVGKAIMGQPVDAQVEVKVPSGTRNYKIISIEK